MDFVSIFMIIVVTAVLAENFVLVQFLGICPFFGVSRKTNSALGMGIAVTVVMVIATLITYPLYVFVLVPLGIEYLEIIFFIFTIASLVQMLEKIIQKVSPPLYNTMGIYLPLITTNCAILGVTELVINEVAMSSLLSGANMNLGYALIYALFAGVGFTLAIVLMGGIREKIDNLKLPKSIKGYPLSMMVACFMAMAFSVFQFINV